MNSRLDGRPSRAKSCAQCRKKKLRCDRNQPCGNCVRSKASSCIYTTGEVTARLPPRIAPKTRLPPSSASSQSSAERHAHIGTTATPSTPLSTQGEPGPTRQEERWHSFSLGSILVQAPRADRPDSGLGASESRALRLATELPLPEDQPHSWASMLHNLSMPIRGTMVKTAFTSSSHWITSISLVSLTPCACLGASSDPEDRLLRPLVGLIGKCERGQAVGKV